LELGVYTKNGRRIFYAGPFPDGTNNVGEFLAIVHALALLKSKKKTLPIYSDSETAIVWVRNKHANTKLKPTNANAQLFELIQRAEKWLKTNTWNIPVLKWETEWWGEIPADFGRK
jgi:ribonuclease HI